MSRCLRRLCAALMIAVLAFAAGCPITPGPDNSNDNNGGGDGDGIEAEIVTPSSSFGMSSLDPPIQVRYNVSTAATNVRGYRVPVADQSPNSAPIGDPVVVATNLTTGTSQFFDFDPDEAGVGYFRVGILYVLNAQEDSAESIAVIQVEGPPNPVFVLPSVATTVVTEGDVVTVTFDCQDPEGVVQWRLYYLSSTDSRTVPADRLGTQLAVGSGNAGSISFQTEGLNPDDYTLGVSATDSGQSVAATVAAGLDDRIVTVPDATHPTPVVRVTTPDGTAMPTIVITAPGTPDVSLYKNDPFTIQFVGVVNEPGATGTIELFYDSDKNASNGFTLIQEDLPVTATSWPFPAGVPEGTYYIGATIRDNVNSPVTTYATGRITVIRTVTVSVTEPNTSVAVAPKTSVAVRWTTNAPDTSGKVDVFAQLVGPSGAVLPNEISILADAPMTTRSATFSSNSPGLFRLSVRLELKDNTKVTQAAPRDLRVSTLPPVIWVGAIAETNPRTDGAVFEGVNFEDNTGSSFAAAGDHDDDGLDDFVISARYGKPFFINPAGIGPGEAYMIYGEKGADRLEGILKLNSVGTSLLRGVTLTGVQTISDTGNTEGLSDVVAIPDADGDGKTELAFGFPRTDSGGGNLALAKQFLSGGVVVLSSRTPILSNPTGGNPVINLDLVGMGFSNGPVVPNDDELIAADFQVFQAGSSDPGNPTEDSCVEGSDQVSDTIIGPSVGFVDYAGTTPPQDLPAIGLAPAQWRSFVDERGRRFLIDEPPAPDEFTCATLVSLVPNPCSGVFSGLNAGSGFISSNATPSAPFGARIVGRADQDHFGTSITISRARGETGAPDLVISAANRSATPNEVAGIGAQIPGSGVAYIFRNRDLWAGDPGFVGIPPRPHQYIINQTSHCSDAADPRTGPITDTTRIAGDTDDQIQIMLGIDDFNLDGRDDIAVGAPSAEYGTGRVYIAYRRLPGSGGLEGDFVLGKLGLGPENPERLDGFLLTSSSEDGLGTSLATGVDLNGDDVSDLVIGSANANTNVGEIIVMFGGTGIISPIGGTTVKQLLEQTRTTTGTPVAARITGNAAGECTGTPSKSCLTNAECGAGRVCVKGQFGFNVANAGDVDGDGRNDLLIAAPNAGPRFDSNPNDGVDQLDALGIDLNLDGVRDEVPGDDLLAQAGVVYIVFGSNRLDQLRVCQGTTTPCTTGADCTQGAACVVTDATINISQLGTSRLKGVILAGRRAGDRMGGGDAGDTSAGGSSAKNDRGRSRGLAGAGDVDGDSRADILLGSVLADPRRDPTSSTGVQNGGEAYLVYGSNIP